MAARSTATKKAAPRTRRAAPKVTYAKFEWPVIESVEELVAAFEANVEWAEGRKAQAQDDMKVNYWNGVIQNAKNFLINGASQLVEDDGQAEADAG